MSLRTWWARTQALADARRAANEFRWFVTNPEVPFEERLHRSDEVKRYQQFLEGLSREQLRAIGSVKLSETAAHVFRGEPCEIPPIDR